MRRLLGIRVMMVHEAERIFVENLVE